MLDLGALLIALLWATETGWRIYKLARFYQIDEYKPNRFARWWFSKRERVLPRGLMLWTMAAVIAGILFDEGGAVLPAVLWLIFSAFAAYTPREREIKKPFVATLRARRLLAASIAISLLVMLGVLLVFNGRLPDSPGIAYVIIGGSGALVWLLGPVWLMLGNLAMTPVEGVFRRAYMRQARAIMARINPTVIGVTGSYGKTTTKQFIADLLNGRFRAYATPKSYNTVMGIALAINTDLADNYAIDHFVVEMGAYFPGEIRRICDLTPPHIGVMVDIGPQHLERFKTLERTAESKYELIAALPPDGIGIFNWDNEHIRAMVAKGHPQTRIAVSREVAPDAAPPEVRFVATDVQESPSGLRFTVHDTHAKHVQPFDVPVIGLHNVTNLLLAIAVCVSEGMTLKELAARARLIKPAESRLVPQVTSNSIVILNDAYSANPVGARSALSALGLYTTGRRVLITPGMIELGPLMDAENRALGEAAAPVATDVVLVGVERTRPIRDGLLEAGFDPDRLHVVDVLADAVAWTAANLRPGDAVLYLNDLPDTY